MTLFYLFKSVSVIFFTVFGMIFQLHKQNVSCTVLLMWACVLISVNKLHLFTQRFLRIPLSLFDILSSTGYTFIPKRVGQPRPEN